MLKKCLVFLFAAVFVIPMIGCGYKNVIGKPVPPLEGYSKVLITTFDVKKSSGKYDDLPVMISYATGTKLGLRFKDKTWMFDQSKEITPISDKMKELNIPAKDLYLNSQLALKLAKALEADLIIVGQMNEPQFTIERSGKIEYDMSQTSNTGAARFYSVYQTAKIRSKVRIIDVSSGKIIWDSEVLGYKPYKTRYRTGETEKFMREETMIADIRKDFVEKLVTKLYPEKSVAATK